MMAANVHALFEPDEAAMVGHLEHLFGGHLDGCQDGLVEIAWSSSHANAEGRFPLDHAQLFQLDDLGDVAAFAAKINTTQNQNVYVGAALRRPDTLIGKRANDPAFYALTAFYVDLDDAGVADRVRPLYASAPPTMAVVTGLQPHTRAQLWWRQEEPVRDPELARRQNLALARALGGDEVVVNPSRVMRLAGSIAWATKPGRAVERTSLVLFDDSRPKLYFPGQFAKAFPPLQSAASEPRQAPAGEGLGLDTLSPTRLLAKVRAGQQWHNNLLMLVGHWLNRGWQDEEILTAAESLTLPGYTSAQTRTEVAAMIAGGRAKWNLPEPAQDISLPPPVGALVAHPLGAFDPASLPRRRWLLGSSYLRGNITVRIAPGGVGKSILVLQEAIALVLGNSALTGEPVHEEGAVWIYNNEDPIDELKRRIAAICQFYGLDRALLADKLFLDSGMDRRLIVAQETKGATIATPDVDSLIAEIKRRGIAALVVDPFVRSHKVNENSNDAIDFVAEQFTRIAVETSCAVILIHHTRKPAQGEGHVGSADAARGASALVNAGRIAQTLSNMTEKDAQDLGIPRNDRRLYVRLDDAKNNLSLPNEQAVWFKRITVQLPNLDSGTGLLGDQVGVLQRADLRKPDVKLTTNLVHEILDRIEAAWKAGTPFSKQGERPLWLMMKDEFEMPKSQSTALTADWTANGVLVAEVHDKRTKSPGFRVVKRPG